MKRRKLNILSLLAASLWVAACSSEEASRVEPVTTTTSGGATSTAAPAAAVAERDYAFLRIVHAVPGAGAVDVVTDKGTSLTGAAYKQVTRYAEVHSEAQNIRLVPAGQTNATPLANNREILVAGHHYTAVAVADSDGEGVTLRVFDDNLTPPTAGRASVRVIHASPDAGEVDVYAKGNNKALFSGVNYQSATNYTTVDPMGVTLELRPAGQTRNALTVSNVRLEADKLYTVIVTGKANGSPKLEASIIQDELTGARTGSSPAPGMSPVMSPTMLPSPRM